MKKRTNEQGFTIIEILVAIGIIGILLAVVLPKYSKGILTSKEKLHTAERESINTQIMLYHLNNDEYPSAMTQAGWTGTTDQAEGRLYSNYFPDGIPTTCNQDSSWVISNNKLYCQAQVDNSYNTSTHE